MFSTEYIFKAPPILKALLAVWQSNDDMCDYTGAGGSLTWMCNMEM